MAEPVMKYGARKGKMSTMRRWIGNASARDIRIFPVPGADVLRLYQARAEMNALLAANPREANVLLVVGELTDALAQKSAVAYQQIPRPRVLVVAGSPPPYLPEPDVQVSLEADFLDAALPQVRQLFKKHAWSEHAELWEPEFLNDLVEDSDNGGGHNHHHHDHGNGDDNEGEHNHEEHEHGQEEDGKHESHDGHGDNDHQNEDHGSENGHNHDHEHDEEDDENGGHDHGDMDFMSMVAMTKDLPRPKDGLPMNRSEVHFGPFHPGLPGGLSVFMELDGDTVIKASVEGGLAAQSFEELLPLDAEALPDVLARLNRLTPQTNRLLAKKALTNAFGNDDSILSDEFDALESERIGSHLNWLATFGKTVGNEWMHQQATRWHALHRSKEVSPEKLLSFLEQVRSMPYLQTKLSIGGVIPDNLLHHLSGPVAKAAGKMEDARLDEEQYQTMGWAPATSKENNPWGRLLVRLEEIGQSLELIENVKEQKSAETKIDFSGSGDGTAKLESPRGTVSLQISVDNGSVTKLHMETPSSALAALVPTITQEAELSDALVQISSLDIAPWAIGFKGMEVDQ